MGDKIMNGDGLDISEQQFMKMSSKERDLITFRNLTHIRKRFLSYSFHRKIAYCWLVALTIALGIKQYLLL